jgi:hypothetical protein
MSKEWNPGGHKGKLHRELGIPEGEKIPQKRLKKAEHSKDGEIRRDAIRANTMEHWHHGKHTNHKDHDKLLHKLKP